MKNLLFLFGLVPLLAWTSPNEQAIAKITDAIRNGDAVALGTFFDTQVEVATPADEDVYDKAAAIKVVSAFFAGHKPTAFSQVHQGASKSDDFEYCIGNMTAGGKTFRVYFYMRKTGDTNVIQELRFDEE